MTCGTVGCSNWMTSSLHQIGVALYVLMAQSIDATLDVDPDLDLMGMFTVDDTYIE